MKPVKVSDWSQPFNITIMLIFGFITIWFGWDIIGLLNQIVALLKIIVGR